MLHSCTFFPSKSRNPPGFINGNTSYKNPELTTVKLPAFVIVVTCFRCKYTLDLVKQYANFHVFISRGQKTNTLNSTEQLDAIS